MLQDNNTQTKDEITVAPQFDHPPCTADSHKFDMKDPSEQNFKKRDTTLPSHNLAQWAKDMLCTQNAAAGFILGVMAKTVMDAVGPLPVLAASAATGAYYAYKKVPAVTDFVDNSMKSMPKLHKS